MPDLLERIALGNDASATDDVASIVRNINHILNTILGSAAASPDLGLPSLSDLLHEFPDAHAILQRALRESIARFEPRVRAVSIQTQPSRSPLELNFTVSARLVGRPGSAPFVFHTSVSRGHVRVE